MINSIQYYPEVFDIQDEKSARHIILTGERGITSEHRWQVETPLEMKLIAEHLELNAGSLVIDYGCGIGRIAKELISEYSCAVLGVDFAMPMRALGTEYVDHANYAALSPSLLDRVNPQADAAIAVWIFQHCLHPEEDISRVRHSLRSGAKLFLVNSSSRCVPCQGGVWANDQINIDEIILQSGFERSALGLLDPTLIGNAISETSFWAVYRAV